MRRIIVMMCLLVAPACGKGKQAAEDWSKQGFKHVDASTGGVNYGIDFPETWQPLKPPDEGWGPTTGDQFKRPHANVSNVSADFASSIESAISAAGAKPENVVRKETKNGDFFITEVHDQTLIRATTFKKVGGSLLWCTASQANDDGIPSFEATKKALVKICDSLAPK